MTEKDLEQIDLCEQELMLLHNRIIQLGNNYEEQNNPKSSKCFKICGLLKDVHDILLDLRDE